MITISSKPENPTTCPFGRGERRTVRIAKDIKTRAGNLIAPAGITYAWDADDAGDPRTGTPDDAVMIWTPDHYAGIEWACVRGSKVVAV